MSNCLKYDIDEDVKNKFFDSIKIFEKMGAIIEEFDININEYAMATYYLIATSEAFFNLSKIHDKSLKQNKNHFDLRTECLGKEVKLRLMLGAYFSSHDRYEKYYEKGINSIKFIKQQFHDVFKKYDLILSPVTPTTAFEIGKNVLDPLKMHLGDIYTVSSNIVGNPAMSIPCGFSKQNNMPIGLQLFTKHFNEQMLFLAGHAFQQETNFHKIYASDFLK